MKNKKLIIVVVAIVAVIAIYFFTGGETATDNSIIAEVKKGEFVITVTTTGELEAKHSTRVMGPTDLRRIRLWQVQISKLIPEGTVVKTGDFIADLDKSEINDRLNSEEEQLAQEMANYEQAKLDTSLTLQEARNKLVELGFSMEEKELELEQSKYEPPATIKRAEISLSKATRDLEQAKRSYEIKVSQAKSKVRNSWYRVKDRQKDVETIQDIVKQFRIKAPHNGILFYHKEWNGEKVKSGSAIRHYDPVVATLPDLDTLISTTYINEVDISKIKKGQKVDITFDAFPDKKMTGIVTSVANAGEKKPNSDAKVFEVVIEVKGKASDLKPGMTTGNVITIDVIPESIYIPLESVHSIGDSITYVYQKTTGSVKKQEIITGKMNENEIIVERGLELGDRVLLNSPADAENISLNTLVKDENED